MSYNWGVTVYAIKGLKVENKGEIKWQTIKKCIICCIMNCSFYKDRIEIALEITEEIYFDTDEVTQRLIKLKNDEEI